ncbi:polysaccharide deacetylase family protein [Streptomyces sp. fd1-xmd]|uniref:polysaccharide deacetylase family protein n=1 Tax=Streptomyces sp. fd1-xmd TaxID=1812480 RepID=UPI0009909E72|nr:polysaccharide deacetylase family protein [Streptomyces sp. fd1-xmd]AQT73782.1 hypothetical protein B1K54_21010 [Streptomyces sp. fd1-xmd]
MGLPLLVARVPTSKEVVFLAFDGGWNHDPAAARILLDRRVPVSLFSLPGAASYDAGYFTGLTQEGRAGVENDTVTHPDLTTLDAAGRVADAGRGSSSGLSSGGCRSLCGRRTGGELRGAARGQGVRGEGAGHLDTRLDHLG